LTKASRAARHEKFERERRIVNYLNAGVSVAEIAAREGVTHRRMRAVVQEILARRMPAPPAEFLAMQVGRLNEALLISYSAMAGDNPEAVDRYVRIVRELDRYHGFAAPQPPAHSCPPRLEAPKASLLLEAPRAAKDEENSASGFNT
jgi:hypothetical protein